MLERRPKFVYSGCPFRSSSELSLQTHSALHFWQYARFKLPLWRFGPLLGRSSVRKGSQESRPSGTTSSCISFRKFVPERRPRLRWEPVISLRTSLLVLHAGSAADSRNARIQGE